MARRPRRRVTALLIILTVVGCSPRGEPAPAPSDLASTTTSVPPAPTTTVSPASTTTLAPASNEPADEIDAEIRVPEGEGPYPAVVLVHGGSWVAGDPAIMTPLARYLTGQGFLTVNARYTLTTRERPGFPAAVEDVACAVRYADTHPDSNGTVTLVGHSAGAHISAIVALDGDDYVGGCPYAGDGLPDRFVGLAGPYDIERVGPAMSLFFGEDNDPETRSAGNPQMLVNENPGLKTLIMYGEFDGLVHDSFSLDFHQALLDAGVESLLELVEGARHNEMDDPDLVGGLIVTWLDR